MTSISCHYSGSLRCTAVHDPSHATLTTDAPVDNQGQGSTFSPTDLIATSLATCLLTIMALVAERHGWPLEGASARLEKTMSPDLPRRIAALEVWLVLPACLEAEQQATLRRAAEGCPVKATLSGAVPISLHWSQA